MGSQCRWVDAVAFFMHNNIKALGVKKLYDSSILFILAANNRHAGVKHEANVFVVNMALPRDEIIKILKVY